MALSAATAIWFIPFVVPICLYVAWTDLAYMKITNKAVLTLGAVYILLGPFALPDLSSYLWGFGYFAIALVTGIALNAGGAMGAGDAKFIAFAVPFVAPKDAFTVSFILAVLLLAAVVTHRVVRATPLRNMAPEWESWEQGRKFPMGLALGPTLALYLCLAALNGA